MKAFQDYYTEEEATCYGCGRNNPRGLKIKTFWDGDESVTHFTPEPFHTAIPGLVYGGLLASLIDCHSTGTAAAALYRAEARSMDSLPPIHCVTAALHINYLKPTPIGCPLEIRGRVKEISDRKVVVTSSLMVNGETTVTGEVVAVRIPDKSSR